MGFKADALGVNAAAVFSAFRATVPGTLLPVASLSENVVSVPGRDEAMVAGSIDRLKVAVTTVPVKLPPILVLVDTFVARLVGLVWVTVGALATTAASADKLAPAPAEARAPSPPPPHPATKAASGNAINHIGGLNMFWIFFIFLLLSLEVARFR